MMRRRPRIDLGPASGGSDQPDRNQEGSSTTKDDERRERKRQRWATVNKHRPPEENPFLAAIKPNHDNYGDPGESTKELRARLESLEFGNYPGYFNYRHKAATTSTSKAEQQPLESKLESRSSNRTSQTGAESSLEDGLDDERLRLMKEDWFRGKNVLDVGCNRGHVTYAIAKLFAPRFILGIDIDLKMINMANRDLHHHLESNIIKSNIDYRVKRAYELTTSLAGDEPQASRTEHEPLDFVYIENDQHFPLSSYVTRGPLAVSLGHTKTNCDSDSKPGTSDGEVAADGDESKSCEKGKVCSVPSMGAFPNNVLFVEHNYVLSKDQLVDKQKAHFDTIVCLSVTKWIHLNYRDEGLKRFFKRMYRHLNEGGLLVLEAQPFDNYHRKKKLSERLRTNFQSIKFKPEQFDEFLLSEQIGFKRILLSTTTEHECAGFKRPMKVFVK